MGEWHEKWAVGPACSSRLGGGGVSVSPCGTSGNSAGSAARARCGTGPPRERLEGEEVVEQRTLGSKPSQLSELLREQSVPTWVDDAAYIALILFGSLAMALVISLLANGWIWIMIITRTSLKERVIHTALRNE